MKKLFMIFGVAMLVLGLSIPGFAASSKQYTISATVPSLAGGLDVTVSKIIPTDCTGLNDTNWTPGQTAIGFGTLAWDTTNKIFKGNHYFAVDLGVLDNSGTVWTITHTRTSLANGANNLDGNVNVAFQKVWKQGSTEYRTDLAKYSYTNSNNKAYTKTQLANGSYQGWLRVYYGIGTGIGPTTPNPGNCTRDADGVLPIGIDKPTGTYSGTVTFTLTP